MLIDTAEVLICCFRIIPLALVWHPHCSVFPKPPHLLFKDIHDSLRLFCTRNIAVFSGTFKLFYYTMQNWRFLHATSSCFFCFWYLKRVHMWLYGGHLEFKRLVSKISHKLPNKFTDCIILLIPSIPFNHLSPVLVTVTHYTYFRHPHCHFLAHDSRHFVFLS